MGIFDSIFQEGIAAFTPTQFFLCFLCSIFVGLLCCVFASFRSTYSKGFLTTLALLPPVVSVVVIIVNDNIGMGLAIAGAFSLMKFRSIPGKAKEMLYLCITLAAGLLCGTGYLGYSIIFALASGILSIVYINFRLGSPELIAKRVRIAVPEDLEYYHAFDDVFARYCEEYLLVKSKTANLGSIFVVYFNVVLKKDADERGLVNDLLKINSGFDISVKDYDEIEGGLS